MTPTFFLACALVCLIVALISLWAERFNAACVRNVGKAEGVCLHGQQADAEPTKQELAGRNMLALKVRRPSEPKPTGQAAPRRSSSAPAPAPDRKKKASAKR